MLQPWLKRPHFPTVCSSSLAQREIYHKYMDLYMDSQALISFLRIIGARGVKNTGSSLH